MEAFKAIGSGAEKEPRKIMKWAFAGTWKEQPWI